MEDLTEMLNSTVLNSTTKFVSFGPALLGWNIFQFLALTFLAFIGITGNMLIAVSIIHNKQMQNLQNYFVFSLAVTDLTTFIIIVPMVLISKYTSWPFGEITCKYILPLGDVVTAVSILTLVAISVDRYGAVWNSLRKPLSLNWGKFIIILIWAFSYITVGIPLVFTFEVVAKYEQKKCLPIWKSYKTKLAYFVSRFVLFYTLPTVIIYVCYILVNKRLKQNLNFLSRSLSGVGKFKRLKQQKRIIIMFFAIFVSFVLSYLPLNCISMLIFLPSVARWRYISLLYELTVLFAFANSTCNPVILYVLSHSYRKHFQRFFPCLSRISITRWLKTEESSCITDESSKKKTHSANINVKESTVSFSTKRRSTAVSMVTTPSSYSLCKSSVVKVLSNDAVHLCKYLIDFLTLQRFYSNCKTFFN